MKFIIKSMVYERVREREGERWVGYFDDGGRVFKLASEENSINNGNSFRAVIYMYV